jgi:CBS domain-containing protein
MHVSRRYLSVESFVQRGSVMLVKDIMNSRPVTCQIDETVGDAARRMKKKKISGMPVMDGDQLAGVISESDVLRLLSQKEEGGLWLPSPFEIFEVPFRDLLKWEKLHSSVGDISQKKVGEIMHADLQTVDPNDSIEEAASIMTRHRINRLPVVEEGKLVGIVTRGDIIAGLGTSNEKD